MAKYTDEQIKKALELCDNWKSGDCLNCPLADECEKDSEVLIHNSLDLINRKEAEIERLQKENNRFADIGKMYSEIKSEAIKEFAERLKATPIRYRIERTEYCDKLPITKMVPFIDNTDIDNLVKEMVGKGVGEGEID